MSETDTESRSASGVETGSSAAKSGREHVPKLPSSLRRGVESGALTAILGGASLVGGLRSLRDGKRLRGIVELALGGVFLAAAVVQRRSRGRERGADVEATDVVDTGPSGESVADEVGGVGEEDHVAGDDAAAVVDTSPDVEDAGSGLESGPDTDAESASVDARDVADTGAGSEDLAEATERETGDAEGTAEPGVEDVDRLGEAAFDRQSREVPVPQRAFNQGFLAHSTEAFWGVRERDGTVLVSQDYDVVAGRDGVRYVASSEIGDDARELPIPDAVLDHWDDVLGGGTAVTGGDDVLFVTTDDLAADRLLRVLPGDWAEDAFGGEE